MTAPNIVIVVVGGTTLVLAFYASSKTPNRNERRGWGFQALAATGWICQGILFFPGQLSQLVAALNMLLFTAGVFFVIRGLRERYPAKTRS